MGKSKSNAKKPDLNNPVLQLVGITKNYELDGFKLEVLKSTSLTVYRGDYLSIRGPSGSGKSTLMHIMGLLDSPTSGKIVLDNKDVSSLSETQLAKIRNQKIGFVFQQFNLLPKTKAWENVSLPLFYCGISPKERYQRAKEALIKVGLEGKIENRPNQLSGGQQQRVAIARALINHPSVIFADEPTGNLDTITGNAIMKMLDDLSQEGKTIVMVTHEPSVARHAKRHWKITDGIVQEEEE